MSLVTAAPALARAAATGWWRVVTWSAGSAVSVSTHVVRRTLDGESPAALLDDMAAELRSLARRLLEIDDGPRTNASGNGQLALSPGDDAVPALDSAAARDLKSEGAALLRRSADVDISDSTHPAYARILSELMPDEARILRLLYLEGPQPSVDVRTNRPLGIGSELVGGGLSMIAEHAGCRDMDRIGPYLTNLRRLGTIDFSKERVNDPQRYQLVEAQPKVLEAMKHAGRAPRTVHRSIRLNSFGQDFCLAVLPFEDQAPAAEVRNRALTGGEPVDE